MTAQRVQIVNRTSRIRDARFAHALPGLQQQISQHFAPFWGVDAALSLVGRGQQPDPAAWKLWLLDTSDQVGDLGYHTADDAGVPDGKIFVEDDIRYAAEITVTMSHELCELLCDPTTVRMAPALVSGREYGIEVCDPVEADADGYFCGDIRVSDFVTPLYFGIPNPGGEVVYDYCRRLARPCPELRPGGYLIYRENGQWQTTAARYADGSLSLRATRPEGRSFRRAARSSL